MPFCKLHLKAHVDGCDNNPAVIEERGKLKAKHLAGQKKLLKDAEADASRKLIEKLRSELEALEKMTAAKTMEPFAAVPSISVKTLEHLAVIPPVKLPQQPSSPGSSSSSSTSSSSSSSGKKRKNKKSTKSKADRTPTTIQKIRDREPTPEISKLQPQPTAPAFMSFKNSTRQRICSASNADRYKVFTWYMEIEDKTVTIEALDEPGEFPRLDMRVAVAIAEISRGDFARDLVLEGERLACCVPKRLTSGRRSVRML